ncbi:MAG: PadR family transcriptional regulator [Salaquimonas sp.]|nr:PadR family transcriptional regulator [Salaquimonas sp.]
MHSCSHHYEMHHARWMMSGRGGRGPGGRSRGWKGGGPFGRHRGGPFGGRGSRMFDSGALRLVVLGLIAEESRHGYDIIKALETRFQGAYSPSPGAIYPMLQMMEEADLVVSETQGNKRLYTITDEGRAYLEENRTELDRINAQLDEASGDMQGVALGDAIRDLRRALYRKVRSGEMDADQAKKAVEILKKARDDLDQL